MTSCHLMLTACLQLVLQVEATLVSSVTTPVILLNLAHFFSVLNQTLLLKKQFSNYFKINQHNSNIILTILNEPPLKISQVHAITSEPGIDGDKLPSTAPDFTPNMQQLDASQDDIDEIVFDQDFLMMPIRCLHQ